MRLFLTALCLLLLSPANSFGQDSVQSVLEDFPSRLKWWDSASDCNQCRSSGCSESREAGCAEARSEGCSLTESSCPLKEISLWEGSSFDIGGSYRVRYHNEHNMRGAGLTGLDDEYVLHQIRLWVTGKLNDRLSTRVEMIDASSVGETFAPRSNEVDRFDLYQAYVDALLIDGEGTLTARLGRQEFALGVARLIQAPNWANRRRNRDGIRLMWSDPDWDIDAFWTRPVLRNTTNFTKFDNTNLNQQQYGIYTTYKSLEEQKLELYWLAFDIHNASGTGGAKYDTIGTRWYGNRDSWLYEFEGGYQFGRNPDNTVHNAGFVVSGVGKKFDDVCWKPEAWLYYDFGSGSSTTGNGFHYYTPAVHSYLGWMDLFSRQNIQDFNARIKFKPAESLTFTIWAHYFLLADDGDVVYTRANRPFAGATAGTAGDREIGQELDFQLTWQANKQTQIRVAYSHFFAGRYYDTTPGVPTNSDADFFYTHFQYTF